MNLDVVWTTHSRYIALLILLVALLAPSAAVDYVFVPERDDIFDSCEGSQGANFLEMVDLSKLSLKKHDNYLSVSGELKWLWQGDEKDNVDVRIETFEKKNGQWSLTPYAFAKKDGCYSLFDTEEQWYNWFSHFIDDDYRVCPTKKTEVVWRFTPFNTTLLITGMMSDNLEALYRATITLQPYDQRNRPKGPAFCTEVRGELRKV